MIERAIKGLVVDDMYFVIEKSAFEKWAHGYVTMLYSWAEKEHAKGLEYLEKADNRSWWKILEPTKEEYEGWAEYYFDASRGYDREAKKILMLIYEEY